MNYPSDLQRRHREIENFKMNREIKFRAWNMATKTLIDLKRITPLALNMDTDGLFLPFSDGLILMQFTGLKDKKGKEIYEGDILKSREASKTGIKFYYIVEWKAQAWNLRHYQASRTPTVTSTYMFKQNIVIGNIYANPELLK